MAITNILAGAFITGQFGSTSARRVDWPGDTVNCILTTSAFAFDQDAHDFASDITDELPNGNGYTTGGVAVTNKVVTYDSATNETRGDCDDPAWVGLLATFRKAVFVKDTGVAATSPIISVVDLGADEVLGVATNWSLIIPATGLWKVTAAA